MLQTHNICYFFKQGPGARVSTIYQKVVHKKKSTKICPSFSLSYQFEDKCGLWTSRPITDIVCINLQIWDHSAHGCRIKRPFAGCATTPKSWSKVGSTLRGDQRNPNLFSQVSSGGRDGGDTALHWASLYGHSLVVKALIKAGASVSATTNKCCCFLISDNPSL